MNEVNESNFDKTFGLVIAFLIPGLIGLFAVSLHSKAVQGWLKSAATDVNFEGIMVAGTLLLVLVLAIGMGVFIAGIRSITLDLLWQRRLKHPRPFFAEPGHDLIIDQFYYYAQFHWHTAIASTGLLVSWLLAGQQGPSLGTALLLWVIITPILWLAGASILNHTADRASNHSE